MQKTIRLMVVLAIAAIAIPIRADFATQIRESEATIEALGQRFNNLTLEIEDAQEIRTKTQLSKPEMDALQRRKNNAFQEAREMLGIIEREKKNLASLQEQSIAREAQPERELTVEEMQERIRILEEKKARRQEKSRAPRSILKTPGASGARKRVSFDETNIEETQSNTPFSGKGERATRKTLAQKEHEAAEEQAAYQALPISEKIAIQEEAKEKRDKAARLEQLKETTPEITALEEQLHIAMEQYNQAPLGGFKTKEEIKRDIRVANEKLMRIINRLDELYK